MSLMEKVKSTASKVSTVSKSLLGKARNTADTLGRIGALRMEAREIEARIHKEESRLGRRVHTLFASGERQSISVKTPGVREIMENIDSLNENLKTKQDELARAENE